MLNHVESVPCDVGSAEWRYAWRKETPETKPLNILALRRRLEAQRAVKGAMTARHSTELAVIRDMEKAAKKAHDKQLRLPIHSHVTNLGFLSITLHE